MFRRLTFTALMLATSFLTSTAQANMDLTIQGVTGSGTTTWIWDVTDVFSQAGSLAPTGANKFAQWSDFGDFISDAQGDANGHFQFVPTNNNVVFEIDGIEVGFGDVFVDHDTTGDDLGFIPLTGISYGIGSTLSITGSFDAPIDISDINDVSYPGVFDGIGTVTSERPFVGVSDLNLRIESVLVPEPSSLTLCGIGILVLARVHRRRRVVRS